MVANFAIIAAGFATQATVSVWPDLVVGLGIFFMNLDAAHEVYDAAKLERGIRLRSAAEGAEGK